MSSNKYVYGNHLFTAAHLYDKARERRDLKMLADAKRAYQQAAKAAPTDSTFVSASQRVIEINRLMDEWRGV